MLATDKTALICDLAETYGVLDYRALRVETLAALAAGLREESRIQMKLAGTKVRTDTLILAAVADHLSFLAWAKTKDAERGENRPKSLVDTLLGRQTESPVLAFESGEEWEAAKAEIIGR